MSTATTTLKNKPTATNKTVIGAAAVLFIAGIAAWVYQLVQGMQVTGLSQQVTWGLYIAAFFVAVGAGAFSLALAGLSEFKPILPLSARTKLLSVALASFVAGGLLITADLGNPLNVWRFLTAFRVNSMMSWDFWLLVVCAVVTFVYLLVARRSETKNNKILGMIAIISAAAVVIVEGLLLTNQAAHTMWQSSSFVLTFLIGAAVAGLGLIVLVLPKEAPLNTALKWMLALSLVSVLAEVLAGGLAVSPQTRAEIGMVLTGSAAPFFWYQVLVGIAVPFCLLLLKKLTVFAGVLSVSGVLAEKLWILSAGQSESLLSDKISGYMFSWVELLVVVGLTSLGVIVYECVHRILKPKA